jgi:hypothetical protein
MLGSRPISKNLEPSIPRLALRVPEEAAAALGVGVDFFNEHVRHELRVVRRGRLVFVGLRELERWLEVNGARATG